MQQINKLRKEIDEIDSWILVLLKKRFDISAKIGKIKAKESIEALDLDRWNQIIVNIENISKKIELDPQISKELYEKIHELSCKKQKV